MIQTSSDTRQLPQSSAQAETSGQSTQAHYESIVEVVHNLPLPMLAALLREVADTIGQRVYSSEQRSTFTVANEEDLKHNSLKLLLGRMKTSHPAPSDEEVAQWLDEHRMKKYS